MPLKNPMRQHLLSGCLSAALAYFTQPLWGQDIQKLLLHEANQQTTIELVFLPGNRFEMQVLDAKDASQQAKPSALEWVRGSSKRVADRMELSVDGRSIGYVQWWSGTGQIQAQLYWGERSAPRPFAGVAFR
jgi:hypothetical protein